MSVHPTYFDDNGRAARLRPIYAPDFSLPVAFQTVWGQGIIAKWYYEALQDTARPDREHPIMLELYWQEKVRRGEFPGPDDVSPLGFVFPAPAYVLHSFNEEATEMVEPHGVWSVTMEGSIPHTPETARSHRRLPPGEVRMLEELNVPIGPKQQELAIHPIASWAPPDSVDLRLLGSCPVTAIEMFTFFPYHVNWDGFSRRFYERPGGWSIGHMGLAMLRARTVTAPNILENHTSFIGKKIRGQKAKENMFDNRPEAIDVTCATWAPPTVAQKSVVPIDYYLADLATGIHRSDFPVGDDKGPLTFAIEYALDRPRAPIKLSDFEYLVWAENLNVEAPISLWTDAINNEMDSKAVLRHAGNLAGYRAAHHMSRVRGGTTQTADSTEKSGSGAKSTKSKSKSKPKRKSKSKSESTGGRVKRIAKS
ncbi:uncharacterized protein N0V89_005329 [Didymosphaeria variabile]|uniref:Uncharacterized protein n=1 Tax=Didymosphaeria variabile TaxID=1932322 RepID=A0A9W8XL96_9PLEO|nr:uncharacterized protein N0V89_005329 [Didymosphaeria variabile]KAJ4353599.1 hypothetical protein N0V89_005329 [Didymosphaeria variabile]